MLLIANACFVWTTDARLERQLAAIREAGDPLTLADLAPKPIPPEKNAATYLRQADADVEAIENKINGIDVGSHHQRQQPFLYLSDAAKCPEDASRHGVRRPSQGDSDSWSKAAACPDYDAAIGLHGFRSA